MVCHYENSILWTDHNFYKKDDEMSERKSKSYIATFLPDDPEIQNLRAFMKKCNRMLKESNRSERYYIKLHGRGHRYGKTSWRQELPLKYAESVDAYIYERMPWKNAS